MTRSTTDSNIEASIRKLAFWLDTVTAYLNTTVACLGGDFNQDAVIAHIKVINIILKLGQSFLPVEDIHLKAFM